MTSPSKSGPAKSMQEVKERIAKRDRTKMKINNQKLKASAALLNKDK